ncbi:MAG: VIT domain-containing protein [Elusimicrobiota bacterium]
MRNAALGAGTLLMAGVLTASGLTPVRQDGGSSSPLSLTASDGTGLRLKGLKARAVLRGPLAFTELRLTFENPQARVLEGRFRLVLPQGASVSRFAMRQEARWQEGEVVELQKARAAYEDFLHRRQDPALLEKGAGNEFTARVFPIPAHGVKELIVSYSQELAGAAEPYILSLRGLPEVGELDVAAASQGLILGELKRTDFVPASDFSAAPPRSPQALRGAELAVLRLRPVMSSQPDEIDSLLILFDSSASRALGFEEQLRLLSKLVEGLARGAGAGVPVAIAAFDQDVWPVFEGRAGDFGPDEVSRLKKRGALGASDLKKALAWAGKALAKRPAKRLLLISDGVATAGTAEAEELKAAVRALKASGAQRLDAVAVGGIRDDGLLRSLAAAGLPRDGVAVSGALEPAEIHRKLTAATRSALEVSVQGSTWSWPKRLDGVQAGDEVLVYARLPERMPLSVTVGGVSLATVSEDLGVEDQPLLERAAAQAEITSLLGREASADGAEAKAKIRQAIVELSTRRRVISPYTALLILETEEDYARFGIDRAALAQIMTIEDRRLTLTQRKPADLVFIPRPLPPAAKTSLNRREHSAVAAVRGAAGASAESFSADQRATRSFESSDGASAPAMAEMAAPRPSGFAGAASFTEEAPRKRTPFTGKYKEIMDQLAAGRMEPAARAARAWVSESPGDLLALVALGEALERSAQPEAAARAYGSIIDLYPSRADLRRFAGARLERLAGRAALELAADSFRKARESRPDHPSSHRLYAFALLKEGKFQEAFEALAEGAARHYPEGRFRGVSRILKEDLGLAAAAWMRAEPSRRPEILAKLEKAGGIKEDGPSVRFVLNWETDANDVDFHIHDSRKGHAFYSNPKLASGGELYADVTTGYGPECFTIRGPKERRAGPYTLEAHYYSMGPMGYGMGKLQVIEHDGKGGLGFEERPYIVMTDGAFVELGVVR